MNYGASENMLYEGTGNSTVGHPPAQLDADDIAHCTLCNAAVHHINVEPLTDSPHDTRRCCNNHRACTERQNRRRTQ